MPHVPVPLRSTVIVLLLAVAGCGETTGPGEVTPGWFAAELGGIVEGSLTGPAQNRLESGTWTLTLGGTASGGAVTMASPPGMGRPAAGPYPLVDFTTGEGGDASEGFVMALVELPPGALPGEAGFDFLAGTLTVTVSTSSVVEGRFELATSVTGDPTRVLVVAGTFAAPSAGSPSLR